MEITNMKKVLLDKDFIFTCTVDINYIDYIYSLAGSINANCPDIPLHIRLVDIHKKYKQNITSLIKKRYKNIIIEFDDKKLSTKKEFFRSNNQFVYGESVNDVIKIKTDSVTFKNVDNNFFLMSERQCYTSNTRFRNILKLLKEGYQYVMYIDADTIIRKNLLTIKEELYNFDISCNVNTAERYLNKKCWELSFIGLKNSKNMFKFIEYCNSIAENDMYDWDADQNAIEEAYSSKYKDTLTVNSKIKHIEDIGQLHEHDYLDESYIWAGSGFNKLKIKSKFIDELNRYYGKN
tara:strand:+ start:11996 stop:12871 length:876 start_codon:yes stop_codon:yes gene_type:complete